MIPIQKYEVLKQYFGHSSFRLGQESLIDALLSHRDALGVMPTGAGKSICYQLPALLLPGITLVISPLISLMKDQVAALSQAGIPAAYINSSLSFAQCSQVLERAQGGKYKIIYVAPERLETLEFQRVSQTMEVSLLAVDEAHCVSQWGQDFRPSYLNIASFVASLPQRPIVAAFTATATAEVREDIEKLLRLEEPYCITTGFDRPNLYFEVVTPKNKGSYLHTFLAERAQQSGIVYCASRKSVESVCESLRKSGIAATRYHAGLEANERKHNQEDFVYDRARVMVATNAFGMGIDKSNVSFVVHYNMPKNLESYYQEAGRAGRDGEKAHCVLLFSAGDIRSARFLLDSAKEHETLSEEERGVVREKELQRLEQMIGYCKTTACLRSYMLSYFGETEQQPCGNCGNCNQEIVEQDITIEAQKILSAVARVKKKYPYGLGITLIVRMLHGSKEKRVLELGLDQLPTYGIMGDLSRIQIRDYIDFLIRGGYLALSGEEYPVLHMAEQAKQVLFHGERVTYTWRRASIAEKAAKKESVPLPAEANQELFGRLKALRTRLAQEENVPSYIVFSNAALVDMASRQPRSLAEFLEVSGVGAVKAERYGKTFLEEIEVWATESSV